jgi:hypothetical protein
MAKSSLHIGKHIALLIILFSGLVMPCRGEAQTREQLLKAGYVEKFTHFVDWSKNPFSKDSIFRVAVIGDKKFSLALEQIFSKIKVNEKNVKVSYITSVDQIKDNLILVISKSISNDKLDEILNYTTGKTILTISEKPGCGVRGSIINLIVVDELIRYEINRITLGKSGLKMNSLLIKSGTLVSTND